MKRLFTVVAILSLLLVLMGAKQVDKTDVVSTPSLTSGAVFENPLADGFKSVTKGKEMVKGLKDANIIHLPYHDFDVTKGEPTIASNLRATASKDGSNYYIVKFSGPVLEKYKSDLSVLTVKFEWPVHNYGYIVKMDDNMVEKVKSLSYVKFVSLWHPAYKTKQNLLNSTSTVKKDIVVRLFRNGSYSDVLNTLNKMGIKIVDKTTENSVLATFVVNVSEDQIDEIAMIKDVYLMSEYAKKYAKNDVARAILQQGSTAVGDTVIWNHGVRGDGQIINVTDSGITMGHYAFYDATVPLTTWGHYPTHRKVIAYLPSNESFLDTLNFGDENVNYYHGTHTSGSSASNDIPNGTANYDGMAKNAKLFFMDCGDLVGEFLWVPIDCYTMFDTMYVHGARVTSNSYGPDGTGVWGGAYDEGCQMSDAYVWDHKDFNVHFAAGNDGSAGTISGTACAKSVYAAGASQSSAPASITSFSSEGPTADGRYGVTCLTPGQDIMSADGGTSGATSNYQNMDGTSMACPISAGGAALVRDWLSQGFYPTGTKVGGNAISNPSSSLVRALMVNSAYDCGQTIPSSAYGWGRTQLNNTLFFNDTAPKAMVFDDNADGLLTGEFIEYQFNVTTGSSELKVTLVWNDYPSPYFGDNTVTDTTLVNDLDLQVYNPSNALVSTVDHLNPIEQYRIAAPATGVWRVRVVGTDLPVSPQPYSIVVSYNVANAFNGYVKFDKAVYSVIDSIATVTVTDNSVDADGSIPITLYSMLGDTEYITVTGTTGIFKGTIKMGYQSADGHNDDDVLGVKLYDTIYAKYNDPDPLQTLTAMATIDNALFTIYNVHTETVEGTRAFIAWNTSEVATGKVYYGTTTALGSETAVDPNLVTDHSGDFSIILSGLNQNTLYYYDVESSDHKGNTVRDNNGGDHYQFATINLSGADILVIVTEDNQDYASGEIFAHPEFLTYAFNQGGWNYAWWYTSVNNFGIIPVANLMRNFKAIFLQSGQENYPPLTKNQEESLKVYEAGGGRIAYTGHDFGWAMASTDGFGAVGTDKNDSLFVINYMMGKYVPNGDIIAAGDFTLYGVTADPISGSFTGGVSYNPFREGADGDSMTAVSAAFVAGTGSNVWRWNATAGPVVGTKWQSTNTLGTLGTGVWGGYQTRVIFNAFEITQIDTSDATSINRTNILNNNLIWLIGHDHPDVTLTSPTDGATYTTNTISIAWTATVYGGTTIDSTFVEYSPNGGDAWITIAKGTTIASPYTWDVSSLLNGTEYMVKVRVKDKGVYPSMSGADQTAKFTIQRTTGDFLGPIVYAGSVRPSVNPVGTVAGLGVPTSFVLTAIICDSSTGMNNIGAAEWSYGASPAAAGSGTAMAAADGSFNSMYETVTATISSLGWPVGFQKVWVRGRDSSAAKTVNNWGDALSGTVIVIDATTTITAVLMTDIIAVADNNRITLKWSTTNEFNNAMWVIERSTDNKKFETIGTLKANNTASSYSFTDENIYGGEVYYYRISDVSMSGTKTSHPVVKVLSNGKSRPTTFALVQNTPNPFSDITTIEYAVSVKGKVSLAIYDITGKLVRTVVNEVKDVAWYRASFDGKDNSGREIASGVYFYKLTAPGFESSMRMTYLK